MGKGPFLPALCLPLLTGPGSVRNYQYVTVLAGWRETWPILLPLPFLAALGRLLRLPHRRVRPQSPCVPLQPEEGQKSTPARQWTLCYPQSKYSLGLDGSLGAGRGKKSCCGDLAFVCRDIRELSQIKVRKERQKAG